jgi:hypothetical protein
MTTMMKWYRRPIASVGSGKSKDVSTWTAAVDYDRRGYAYWRDSLNCAYAPSHALYTADTYGYPIGDLNWFPTKYTAWRADSRTAGVAPTANGVPSAFALQQNYPNPFNPSTKISFTLGKSGFTTLSVYNLLGQKVATVLAKDMAAGSHEVSFDASNLSSGIYFYRLESGKSLDVKKMMLLK